MRDATTIQRLWGQPAASKLGRPAELALERIVEKAVELADSQGVAGLALPRIAKALGYTTMALYRHVGSKEELVSLAMERATGPAPECADLREWARELRAVYRRRPWLARVPVSGPPAGPNGVAWMEAGLRPLAETRLNWEEKLGALMLVSGYVRQAVLLEEDLGPGQAEAERAYGEALAGVITPERFPQMAALLRSGVLARGEEGVGFEFGLERILAGLDQNWK